MSLISSIRSSGAGALQRGDAAPSPTDQLEAEAPLPRHLLVALAGIAADVASLRQRYDEPPLQEPLDRILGRLDGLVDSIYERAAASRARPAGTSGGPGRVVTVPDPVTVHDPVAVAAVPAPGTDR